MVKELGPHPALGSWEIINEYEGSLRVPESNSNKCFDTNVLQNSGAGWTGVSIPMER
jgi:mannan endo-1,4-beta-mannosidase